MKTLEEIAEHAILNAYALEGENDWRSVLNRVMEDRDGDTAGDLLDVMRQAIGADRAQRHPYSVIARQGRNDPESIVGDYLTRFDAEAVADAWNGVNGKYGIEYRVEED